MTQVMSDGSSWRFIAERLNGDGTSTLLDPDLPVISAQITEAESDLNAMTFTISPEVKRLLDETGRPALQEWSTALYAEKDGEIRMGAMLVHSQFQGAAWSLECVGFLGYGKDMPYTGSGRFFIETDTLDIARFLWTHIQAQDGGNIGLEFSQNLSGVKVGKELESQEYDPVGGAGGLTLQTQAYKLAYYQDLDLLSNFDDLASESPFRYLERHYWDGDDIRHQVDFITSLPTTRNNLRFALGENVITHPSVTLEGDDYASEAYVLGAGEGAQMIRGHAVAPRTRLRRVAVRSDASIRRLSSANTVAGQELYWRRNIQELGEITVIEHEHAPLGSYNAGDIIYVQGNADWIGEIGAWYKITQLTYAPGQTAQTLTLARVDKLLFGGPSQ